MEERMIIVSQVKSNRSEFMVWQVSINNEQTGMQHCTSPLKALRYCFILKKQMGVRIASEAISTLQQEIARVKAAQAEAGKEKIAEVAQEFIETHSVDAVLADRPKPKPKRKPRTKKNVESAAVPQ